MPGTNDSLKSLQIVALSKLTCVQRLSCLEIKVPLTFASTQRVPLHWVEVILPPHDDCDTIQACLLDLHSRTRHAIPV